MKKEIALFAFAVGLLPVTGGCNRLFDAHESLFFSTMKKDEDGTKYHSFDSNEPSFERTYKLIQDGTITPKRWLSFYDAVSIWTGKSSLGGKKETYLTFYTSFKSSQDAFSRGDFMRVKFSGEYVEGGKTETLHLDEWRYQVGLDKKYSFEEKAGLYPFARVNISKLIKCESLVFSIQYVSNRKTRSFGLSGFVSQYSFEMGEPNKETSIKTPFGHYLSNSLFFNDEIVDNNKWFFTNYWCLHGDERRFKKGRPPECGDDCEKNDFFLSLWHDIDMYSSDEVTLYVSENSTLIKDFSKATINVSSSDGVSVLLYELSQEDASNIARYRTGNEGFCYSFHIKDLFGVDYSSSISIGLRTASLLRNYSEKTERVQEVRYFFDLKYDNLVPKLSGFYMENIL